NRGIPATTSARLGQQYHCPIFHPDPWYLIVSLSHQDGIAFARVAITRSLQGPARLGSTLCWTCSTSSGGSSDSSSRLRAGRAIIPLSARILASLNGRSDSISIGPQPSDGAG